jgi:hypothetical protein
MYFDDFLNDCKLHNVEIRDKNFSTDNSVTRSIIEKYLKETVIISVDNRQLTGKLLDMNLADNEISMNLAYGSGKKLKEMKVKNLILTGLYSDQSNMIIVKIDDIEEGFKLTSDNTERTFKLK